MNSSYNLAKDCETFHSQSGYLHTTKDNEKAKDERRNENLLINCPR